MFMRFMSPNERQSLDFSVLRHSVRTVVVALSHFDSKVGTFYAGVVDTRVC